MSLLLLYSVGQGRSKGGVNSRGGKIDPLIDGEKDGDSDCSEGLVSFLQLTIRHVLNTATCDISVD